MTSDESSTLTYEDVKCRLHRLVGEWPLDLQVMQRQVVEREASQGARGKLGRQSLEQQCVNYLRHEASTYSNLVGKLSCPDELCSTSLERHVLHIERRSCVATIKKRILDEIAAKYPWLDAECARQKARDGVEDDAGEFVLPFGPFKGKRLCELERDYLIRLLGQSAVRKSFRTRIERHVAERDAKASRTPLGE
jgi:hypothetical protein